MQPESDNDGMNGINGMKFQSLLSENESSSLAATEVIQAARDAEVGDTDVAFVFLTADHRGAADDIVERLWLELDPQCIVGCLAEGVIAAGREVERSPGLAVLVGQAPGVHFHPFHISVEDWNRIIKDGSFMRERMRVTEQTRALIGFGDPWTTPLQQFLDALDQACPNAPLIGGMASGARSQGENVLIRNDKTYDQGFVGVSLSGAIDVETVVSQGGRPIGQRMIITKAHDNIIEQLGGRAALLALREQIEQLSQDEQALLEHGLLIGRAISEYRETFGRGDFLVRNVSGADQNTGAIAMSDYVRVGQTVQFHVRDADSADEDLRLMLQEPASNAPAAGLLFSCNGRGTRMFEAPCHDVGVAAEAMPDTPVAGFFAAGEFGPVGGKNFIHGHTASIALLRAKA